MQDISFKAYILVTDRSGTQAEETELQKLEFMYEDLLGSLLLRHRKSPELLCHIEQNDSLRRFVKDLPDKATRRAYEKLGRSYGYLNLTLL